MPRPFLAVLMMAAVTGGFGVPVADAQQSAAAAKLCQRAMAAFRSGPVNFEESKTTILPSGRPVLDRVVTLASTCRRSAVEITGHTDSSGDESQNRRLSLARAAAVADYLVRRGIPRHRIVVAGVGSSEPIADNALRYGRRLNRRIEIALRPLREPRLSPQRRPPGS